MSTETVETEDRDRRLDEAIGAYLRACDAGRPPDPQRRM